MTLTFMRTSGRTSAANVPSPVAMSTVSCTAWTLAITRTMRGSMARVSRSIRSSHATFVSSFIESSGSTGW